MNSSEFNMLMESYCIPEFMRRSIGGDLCEATRNEWDKKCQEYYRAMGSPDGLTWRDVLIPFGISLDHAPIHLGYRKGAVLPRVSRHQEFTALFEHAVTGLGFNIQDYLSRAFADEISDRHKQLRRKRTEWSEGKVTTATKAITRLRRLKREHTSAVDFFVQAQFMMLPDSGDRAVATAVLHRLVKPFEEARAAYRDRNDGLDWISVFRRDQAFMDRRWLCFLPEQIMPLGNTTPDLHQIAEMLVYRCKAAMKLWTVNRKPDDTEVLLAKNYDESLHVDIEQRNNGTKVPQDRDSIRAQLKRMWIAAQMVAAEYGTQFYPDLPPNAEGVCEKDTAIVVGTGGRFPPKKYS